MFLSKDHLCWLSYVAMSDHEHGDGELGEVPSATAATPDLSIGNEAGTRKGRGRSRRGDAGLIRITCPGINPD